MNSNVLDVGVLKLTIGSHAQTMFFIGTNPLDRFWVGPQLGVIGIGL